VRLKVPDPSKRLKQGVLDKIIGIGEGASPLWQSSACPPLQRATVSREELVDRL
jgi:hypothetical protein